jgi:molybdopterin/thiamine biosynthesis adenylyltransferase
MRRLDDFRKEFYRRNILLREIGEKGQRALLGSRVLVVGAGGLGSPALFYLAAAGVGKLGIADGDRVAISNLQRQILYGVENVGEEKTSSARKSLMRIRPDLELEVFPFKLDGKNAGKVVSDFDFVVDASDTFQSKFLVNDACVEMGRPFSHAGVRGFYGQTMTVIPGESPCCRCVFGDGPEPGDGEAASEAGVLGSVAGIMGAVQATEAVKFIVGNGGLLTGRILTVDALGMVFRSVPLPHDLTCDMCRAA